MVQNLHGVLDELGQQGGQDPLESALRHAGAARPQAGPSSAGGRRGGRVKHWEDSPAVVVRGAWKQPAALQPVKLQLRLVPRLGGVFMCCCCHAGVQLRTTKPAPWPPRCPQGPAPGLPDVHVQQQPPLPKSAARRQGAVPAREEVEGQGGKGGRRKVGGAAQRGDACWWLCAGVQQALNLTFGLPLLPQPQRVNWGADEEAALINLVREFGRGNWKAICKAGVERGELEGTRNHVRGGGGALGLLVLCVSLACAWACSFVAYVV